MNLSILFSSWRWAERLSLRDAAAILGIPHSTLSRFEKGESIAADSLAKLIAWAMTTPSGKCLRCDADNKRGRPTAVFCSECVDIVESAADDAESVSGTLTPAPAVEGGEG